MDLTVRDALQIVLMACGGIGLYISQRVAVATLDVRVRALEETAKTHAETTTAVAVLNTKVDALDERMCGLDLRIGELELTVRGRLDQVLTEIRKLRTA